MCPSPASTLHPTTHTSRSTCVVGPRRLTFCGMCSLCVPLQHGKGPLPRKSRSRYCCLDVALLLEETVSEMLQARNLTYKQLERLHGRLVWFNSHIFGRSINKAVRVISKRARQREGSVVVGEELVWALHHLLVVTNAQPLKISKCPR